MLQLITVAVLLALLYTTAMFRASRRRRPSQPPAPDGLFFVFMVPCFNEEVVIGNTLDRLLATPIADFAILVIDDGSDDATAAIVASRHDSRVWLHSRRSPDARKGKGEALNAGYRVLRDSELLAGHRREDVVVAVLDADGRLEPNAVFEVAPYFRDPKAGAVQVGVRMYNATENVLSRMQDFEFVTFTEIFQRGRQRLGSVGLGGNGQFVRFGALVSLGDAPWTACLTEDLDLGIQLLLRGWHNNYCPTTHVNQQAVTGLSRFVRQRSRWFQGHLQCWRRLPALARSDLPVMQTIDLVQNLLSASLVLIVSIPLVVFYLSLATAVVVAPHQLGAALLAAHGIPIIVLYLLSFGLAPIYAYVYWLRTPHMGLLRCFVLAHLFTLYSYLWVPAGWWAVTRIVFRRQSWAKTARTVEVTPG